MRLLYASSPCQCRKRMYTSSTDLYERGSDAGSLSATWDRQHRERLIHASRESRRTGRPVSRSETRALRSKRELWRR